MRPTRLVPLLMAACAATYVLSATVMLGTAYAQATALPVVVDPNASPDLGTLLQLITSRAWLPLAIFATIWLRHMLSDRSKLPITIPATWLPTVSAGMGLLVAVLVAVQAGAPVATAVLGAFVAAATSGFFDGVLAAIFGDPARAPAWARWLVALADGFGTGGKGSAGDAPKPYRDPDATGPGNVVQRAADQLPSSVRRDFEAACLHLAGWSYPEIAAHLGYASAAAAARAVGTCLERNPAPSPIARRVPRLVGVGLVAVVLGALVCGTHARPTQATVAPTVAVAVDEVGPVVEPAPAMLAGEGCTPQGQPNVPMVVTVTTETLQAIACGVGVVGRELSSADGGSPDWPQIAIDLGETCGMDVAQIIATFGAGSSLGKAALANSDKVHAAAMRYAAHAAAAAGARR